MPPAKPVAFHDLKPSSFPFVIEYLRDGTEDVVLRTVVEGPGVVEIPPLGPGHWVRVRYADGYVAEDRD